MSITSNKRGVVDAMRAWNKQRVAERRDTRNARTFSASADRFSSNLVHRSLPLHLTRAPVLSHAGHAGDVVYSLPAAREIAEGKRFELLLRLGVPDVSHRSHPSQGVRLDAAMANRLLPLLQEQRYIARAALHSGEAIDVELDVFRQAPVNTERGHIARWYCAVFPIALDLSQAWLSVAPQPGLRDVIVLARSARYRNPVLTHAFLRRYGSLAFVGLESEFREMRTQLPTLDFIATQDFLELARVIAGCRLFVGNQSAPFAIAEGLKVPRVLEVYNAFPNVIPEGSGGFQAWFQPQFEQSVERCLRVAST